MVADKYFPYNQCCTIYMKPHPDFVDKKLLKMAKDEDLTITYYTSVFNKKVQEETTKKILAKYHPNLDMMYLSSLDDDSPDSSSGILNIHNHLVYLYRQFSHLLYHIASINL